MNDQLIESGSLKSLAFTKEDDDLVRVDGRFDSGDSFTALVDLEDELGDFLQCRFFEGAPGLDGYFQIKNWY